MILKFLGSVFLLSVFLSCLNSVQAQNEENAPVVILTAPVNGGNYSGDMFFRASVEQNADILNALILAISIPILPRLRGFAVLRTGMISGAPSLTLQRFLKVLIA